MENFNYKFNLKIKKKNNFKFIYRSLPDLQLPTNIDLSTNLDFIYDQKSLGSCTANSTGWLYRYYRQNFNPSRLHLYYFTRLFDEFEGDNSVKIDDGSTLFQSMNVLKKKGVVPDKIYPYNIKKFNVKPPRFLNKIASRNKIKSFQLVNQDINSIKSVLSSGDPFVFGIMVYSSFLNSSVFSDGIIPYPNISTERFLGGHALVAIGYDDNTQLIKCVNSFGRSWGDNGYAYIPYNYILNTSLTDDLWMITNNGLRLKEKKRIKNNLKRINNLNQCMKRSKFNYKFSCKLNRQKNKKFIFLFKN